MEVTFSLAGDVYAGCFETYITFDAVNLTYSDLAINRGGVDGVEIDGYYDDGEIYIYFASSNGENKTEGFDLFTITFDKTAGEAELEFAYPDEDAENETICILVDGSDCEYSFINTTY